MSGLNSYFDGVAAKVLSQVEANPKVSHQHEFNGATPLKVLFGEPSERLYVFARHIDMERVDDDSALVTRLTWYNSRAGKPRAAEWRLYYLPELAHSLQPGGTVVLAKRDENYYCFTAGAGTSGQAALNRLFALDGLGSSFRTLDAAMLEHSVLAAAERFVLGELGIAPDDEQALVDRFLEEFGGEFPTGEALSSFVRRHSYGVDAVDEPDEAILTWARIELELFNAMEAHVETARMDEALSLDDKLAVAMSIFQRRRSRAGKAFEYHLRALFDLHGVAYSANPVTESSEEPDFIFPSIERYHDASWPNSWLTMLAAKQTLRDRWRQVLREATRIDRKHLATLDPNLSGNQVREIDAVGIQLVLPTGLQSAYDADIATAFWSIAEFLEHVKTIQIASRNWPPNAS